MSNDAVLVKICGIRTLEAAQVAVDAGADLLGFICYPAARRYLSPEQIIAILTRLRHRSSVRAVGVFVNQPVEEINAVANRCGLDLVQLSGDETPEVLAALDRPVIKAFRPAPCETSPGLASLGHPLLCGEGYGGRFLLPPSPPRRGWLAPASRVRSPALHALLLEPPTAGWGGAGQRLDWRIARGITELADRPRIFLAGGLTPETVAAAIAAVRPEGVDVSSGVETAGVQDCVRIAAFVAAARGATA